MDPEPLQLAGVSGLSAGSADAPETLVCLHGWGANADLWCNTLALLSDRFRGIALDLPGTGQTTLPGSLRTMQDMASWLVQTCGRLGLERVTLAGHSLGGNLVAQAALDCPSLVRRLILVDAALEPVHLAARARWPIAPRYGLAALRLSRLAAWPLAAAGRAVPAQHSGGYWLPQARRTYMYVDANPDDQALQVQLRALWDNPVSPERLAAFGKPLLILHGARDGMVPVSRSYALALALPHARLIVFPAAHHCPMDHDPPAFAQAIRDFCDANP